jgi:hypothetical protein
LIAFTAASFSSKSPRLNAALNLFRSELSQYDFSQQHVTAVTDRNGFAVDLARR